jgi:hypothetical protein
MIKTGVSAAVAALFLAGSAAAQAPDASRPLTERTEKIGLSGRKGPSLFRPGFGVGEYTGVSQGKSKSVRAAGIVSRDSMQADFTVTAPSLPQEVSASCAGKEGLVQLLFVTFDRDDIYYDCAIQNGGKAETFRLALSKGSLGKKITGGAQRAAEMTWNGKTYRAETRRIGGFPLALTGVSGYAVSRDGVDIGALDLNGIRPTFYLPLAGSPDRDAVAVMALTLFFFQDPARANR